MKNISVFGTIQEYTINKIPILASISKYDQLVYETDDGTI